MSEKLIPIAHLQRHHGVPRDGVLSFKARLPLPGSEIFADLEEVSLSTSPLAAGRPGDSPDWDSLEWKKIKLATNTQPAGGKWEETPMVIVSFHENDLGELKELKNHWIALSRSQFPSLNESEFFLCDLYGCKVQDENGEDWGKVAEVYELGKGSYNLLIQLSEPRQSDQHKSLEVPAKWIDWGRSQLATETSKEGLLCIPEIKEWLI